MYLSCTVYNLSFIYMNKYREKGEIHIYKEVIKEEKKVLFFYFFSLLENVF